jgi:DNA-binding GntR family transcriptional regulator
MAPRARSLTSRRDPKSQKSDGSIVEAIIEIIKEGVRDRRFAPGQRLIESDIRRAVGASRSSVREAMRRLAAENLIDLKHYKGARVRVFAEAEVIGLYQVREMLEGLAARLAAENIGRGRHRSQLTALEKSFDRGYDGSPTGYMRYNEQFHALVVRMSESDILIRLVGQLHIPVYTLQFHSLVDPRSVAAARRQHKALAKAILAGDGTKAERLMRQHVRDRLAQVLKGFPVYYR